MIQAADKFSINDQKPMFFHAGAFYRHTRALLDEVHVPHLEQGEEKFSISALFVQTKIQQSQNITYTIMDTFITTRCPFRLRYKIHIEEVGA